MPSPISSIAWSQLMRFHSPPSFFIGYFRRRSPWACSRTAAPLAQCAPRLNGLSQPGSCPVQTPLLTSATTVQPTEQCVQTDLMVSTAPLAAVCAEAWVTVPPVAEIAARPPMAKPEPRKNERRSTDFSAMSDSMPVRWGRRATPLVFFFSMFLPSIVLTVGRHATSRQEIVRKASEVLEPGAVEICARVRGVLHRLRCQIDRLSFSCRCASGKCHGSSRCSCAG